MLYEFVKKFNFSYAQIKDFLKNEHNSGVMLSSNTHILHHSRDNWIVEKLSYPIEHSDFIITENMTFQLKTKIVLLFSYKTLHSAKFSS